MISRKRTFTIAILSVSCLIIHFYSISEERVENGYSSHFYKQFSGFLRIVFGWIPFSIGDIFYGLLAGWIIWKLIRFLKLAFTKAHPKKRLFANALFRIFVFCSMIYIIFNIFWGINYNRKGIAWQLGLDMEKYTPADLREMNGLLTGKINNAKMAMVDNKMPYPSNKELFKMVGDSYKNISLKYPFLKYEPVSVKSSMWGWFGNYTGFTGYYNPFTGEAQVNTTVPEFLHSFITCHEVAHQAGYAKEMEANFVGYLAAANSGNTLFQYSVYLDLFIYANRNLNYTDSAAAGKYRRELRPEVIADLKEWAAFNRKHQSWAEPIVRWIYGKYLQGNKQPNGVLSYDEVTGFIIAYYKKFGRI